MSTLVPAERVAELLLGAGYRRLPTPLEVAGLSFEIAGAFVGGEGYADLVVVGDMATDGERKVVQQIDGIARALDVMRSRRPLTSVIVGPRPVGKALDSLSQVGRMLPVEEADDPDDLRDRLAILLPLLIPETLGEDNDLGTGDASDAPYDGVEKTLYDASEFGEDAVREAFHEALNSALADGFGEPDDFEDILG